MNPHIFVHRLFAKCRMNQAIWRERVEMKLSFLPAGWSHFLVFPSYLETGKESERTSIISFFLLLLPGHFIIVTLPRLRYRRFVRFSDTTANCLELLSSGFSFDTEKCGSDTRRRRVRLRRNLQKNFFGRKVRDASELFFGVLLISFLVKSVLEMTDGS